MDCRLGIKSLHLPPGWKPEEISAQTEPGTVDGNQKSGEPVEVRSWIPILDAFLDWTHLTHPPERKSCGKNFTLTCGEFFPPQKRHKKNTRQPQILHHFHFQVHLLARKVDLEVPIKTSLMAELAKAFRD